MTDCSNAAALKVAFLQESAKLLAIASPSTASYIATELNQMTLLHAAPYTTLSDTHRQTFCTACGNVFIPKLNCSVTRGTRETTSKGRRPIKPKPQTMVYSCDACHRQTIFQFPKMAKSANKPLQKKMAAGSLVETRKDNAKTMDVATKVEKQSRKKRAKARKEKASLQSLLSKSKEERSASPQLNLMDFMMP
jgi:RNase P subunit RPR2